MITRILGISGSLRHESSNRGLITIAHNIATATYPNDVALTVYDKLGELPFYNEDLEDPSRTPAIVSEWRNLVSDSDALFIAAPEYNFGPSAVLKNAIDWVTRPPGQHALTKKAISIISSSGGTGGAHVIEQLGNVLALLGNTVVSEPNGQIPKGAARISSDGSTTDPDIERLVAERLNALVSTARDHG